MSTDATEKERAVIKGYLRLCGGSAPPMLLDVLRVLSHPDLIDATSAWLSEVHSQDETNQH